MATITQYRPAYFDGFPAEKVKFETTEELLKIPFVKHFKKDCGDGEPFIEFSIADEHLMANYGKNGKIKTWYIVGTIAEKAKINLPKFK